MSYLANLITKNRILGALPLGDLEFMHPHLERVTLRHGEVLIAPDRRIEYAYFVERGLASTIAETAPDAHAEVGLVGCEGIVGIPVVLGADRAPYRVVIQGPGEALRIAADDLRRIMAARSQVQTSLLLYVQAFLVQVSQTAAVDARFSTRERLARWLLMAHDRMSGNQLPLTHEYLALMLGTRRATVSTLLPDLEGWGAIRNVRGRVMVLDRTKLAEIAGASYGAPEREYARLIALFPGQSSR
jgi:CRP-like cAMP-binding protein